MFKLVRLLRLGRIITFLKMNQAFKQGMRIVQLIVMLIMLMHWISCLWYYIVNINSTWYPPKDVPLGITIIYD